MGSLLKYHARTYIASSKFVMPLLIYFLYLAVYYSAAPKSIVPSFIVSMCVLYMLMVWIGYTYSGSDNAIAEQIAILKVGSQVKYYLGKIILLFVIGVLMSFMGIIVPLIMSGLLKISGSNLYGKEVMRLITVIIAFGMHVLSAFLGASVGFFFHPQVMRNRKIAVMAALLMGILGLLKCSLIKDFAAAKFVVWIFPPISDYIEKCATCKVLFPTVAEAALPAGMMLIYAVIISGLTLVLIKKKGF